MSESEKPNRPFRRIGFMIAVFQGLFRLLTLIGGGWLVYSRFFIPRGVSVTHALGGERRELTLDDETVVSYYVSGKGKPVVLLHDIWVGASAYDLKPVYEHLSADYRVHAVDWPGFGFASRVNRDYSPAFFAAVLIRFLEAIMEKEDGPADVVACGLSAEFAAIAAVDAPHLFRSLTFIAPTGFRGLLNPPRQPDKTLFYVLHARLWSQGIYDLLTTRRALYFELDRRHASRQADPGLVSYAYRMARQPGARYAPVYFLSGRLTTPEIEVFYESLNVPVLVITDASLFSRLDSLNSFGRRANWIVHRLQNTRSMPYQEHPRAVNDVLSGFLSDYAQSS